MPPIPSSRPEVHLPIGKERNDKGELKYNVNSIINGLTELSDEKRLIDYVCFLFKENRKEIILNVYREYGKGFLIKMIEKALIIDNEGGIEIKKKIECDINKNRTDDDNNNNNEVYIKRTIGGTLYYLFKHCDEIPKPKLNQIFWRNNKKKHAKRKFNKAFDKMSI